MTHFVYHGDHSARSWLKSDKILNNFGDTKDFEEKFRKTCDQDKAETENGGKSQSHD